jgi:protocatechuate 3,4-dioxygenase beta subunit
MQKKTPRSEMPAEKTSRRQALQLLGAVGVGAIAGCSQSSHAGDGLGSGIGVAGNGVAGGGGGSSATGGRVTSAGGATGVAGAGVASAGVGVGVAGRSGEGGGGVGATSGRGGTAGGAIDADVDAGAPPDEGDAVAGDDGPIECVLTAEQEEGPFYVPMQQIRGDLTDGKQGVPLKLTFTVVDVTTCQPLANAAVDIWHCDYTGGYSDASAPGTSGQPFHRGIQITTADGRATFDTFFPGWYPARTVHVHIKVHVGGMASGPAFSGGHVSHTGNVFFPQAMNDAVAAISPYKEAGTPARKLNADDMVWNRQGGSKYVCTVSGSETTAITASIVLGVDPMAMPALIGVRS